MRARQCSAEFLEGRCELIHFLFYSILTIPNRIDSQSIRRQRPIRLSSVRTLPPIQLSTLLNPRDHTANPYFLAYPHLGLTFLLDPTSHTLLKTILHSNTPGEVSFGRSSRCSFLFTSHDGNTTVLGESGFAALRSILTGTPPVLGARSIPGTIEEKKKGESPTGRMGSIESGRSDSPSPSSSRPRKSKNGGNRFADSLKVSEEVSVEVREKKRGEAGGERPMILDRTVDGGDAEVVGKTTGEYD